MIESEEIFFNGSPCLELTIGDCVLIVALDFGPRILSLQYKGGQNLFFLENGDYSDPTRYHFYGGHRLWRAPEDRILTYHPDNAPLTVEATATSISLVAPIEQYTQLQKTIIIEYLSANRFSVRHIIQNHAVAAQRFAPWALSMMAPGGIALVPLAERVSHTVHVLPTQQLILWGYTDLSDERLIFAPDFIGMRQSPLPAQKIGLSYGRGCLAYILPEAGILTKRYTYQPNAEYPDRGASLELFSNEVFLELETLGALENVAVGESVVHSEVWELSEAPPRLPQETAALREIVDTLLLAKA